MNKFALAVAAAVGVFGSVPAVAQILLLDIDQTVPMAATMDNPCSAQLEAIVFKGTAQVAQRVWLMPNGNLRLQVAETTAMQGQDSAVLLGASPTYTVSGGNALDVEFIPDSVTIWNYHQVTNSAGTTDNFHSVLTLDFDPGTLTLKVSVGPACDDGQPH